MFSNASPGLFIYGTIASATEQYVPAMKGNEIVALAGQSIRGVSLYAVQQDNCPPGCTCVPRDIRRLEKRVDGLLGTGATKPYAGLSSTFDRLKISGFALI